MSQPALTPAQIYRDAIWESTLLTPEQRIVALCYANHARGGERAWVSIGRLMEQTGIRSRSTACAKVADLIAAGWLAPIGPHPEHRQRIVYRLAIPDESTTQQPAPKRARREDGRYTSKTETGPRMGPVQHVDRSMYGEETGPRMEPEPVHVWSRTGPARGLDSLDSPDDSLNDSPRGADRRSPLALLGATAEEEEMIIEGIRKNNPKIKDIGAYVAAMGRNGDLEPLIDVVRSAMAADAISTRLAEIRRGPECEHLVPGGDQPHPATGDRLCPMCRLVDEHSAADTASADGNAGEVLATAPAEPAVPELQGSDQEAAEIVTPRPYGSCSKHPSMAGTMRPDGQPWCPVCRATASRTPIPSGIETSTRATDGASPRLRLIRGDAA